MKILLFVIIAVIFLFVSYIGALFTLITYSCFTSVDMVTATVWAFKSDSRGLVWGSGLIYIILALLLLGLFQKPYILLNMGLTHKGALLGYAKNTKVARLYDPDRREYVDREMNPPAMAAERFDRVFEVVAIYRLFPLETPLNVKGQRLLRVFLHILIILLTFLLLSGFQYVLAKSYIESHHLEQELTPKLFISEFWPSIKESMLARPLVLLLILVGISLSGGFLVSHIIHGYEKKFAGVRDPFKAQIMEKVKPGQELRGRLVNRMFNYKKIHDDTVGISLESDRDYRRTVSTTTYTFSFDGLVRQTPVYLSITYQDFDDQMPLINRLDRNFPPRVPVWQDPTFSDTRLMVPTAAGEFTFRVDKNYGITLLPDSR